MEGISDEEARTAFARVHGHGITVTPDTPQAFADKAKLSGARCWYELGAGGRRLVTCYTRKGAPAAVNLETPRGVIASVIVQGEPLPAGFNPVAVSRGWCGAYSGGRRIVVFYDGAGALVFACEGRETRPEVDYISMEATA